ncbi:MAG: CdaR family protein [Lawsonibacter sp.]|nr:CdaR family protein [Lawsonibacter sp.]
MERLRESKWVYVLLSILLAVVFWLYVRAELDPPQASWFYNVPVQMAGESMLTRQGLTVSALSTESVSLRVEAPASVLDSLARNRKNFWVTVDVSKCVDGENRLNYTPSWPTNINTEKVTTVNREPEGIIVTVEKLYTSTFNVEFQLRGKVADGYQAGTPAISPETVVVSGSVEQVSQVAKVVAVLESENLNERFAGDLPLKLFNAAGEELTDLDVTLDSNYAYVVLPVVIEKEIPLTVNFIPGGGATEEDITWEISPSTIVVSGSETDLQDLTELSLGSVDLSKVVGTNHITFPIALDPSLENVSGVTSATVTVTINGLSTRMFDVDNIQLSNVPDGYSVTSATQVRTVVVRGREEDLANIDVSQLRIVADMSDITTVGTYSVPVKAYLDANSSVGVIGEYSIVVKISK